MNDKGVRTYTRKFLVTMSSIADAPPTPWGSIPINRYSAFPGDSGAVAVSLDCQPISDQLGLFYEVTYTYTSAPFDKGNASGDPAQTDQSTVPTSRPWVIKFGSTHSTRLLTKDVITGAAVVNSVGQPFDPTVEIPTSNMTITVTAYKDFNTFDPVSKQLTYQDTINDAALLMVVTPATTGVFPAKTLRCTEYSGESYNENGATYWKVDLTLEYKPSGWNPISILDAGTCYVKSLALPPQPILDETGNPVTTPVPLNGAGGKLNAGAALVYKDFSGYYERNFATILT